MLHNLKQEIEDAIDNDDKEELKEIIENNDIKIEEKQDFLRTAIEVKSLESAEYFLENGITLKNDMFLEGIVSKRECVKLLKMLDKYNVDLTTKGNMLILRAVSGGKIKNVQYLFNRFHDNNINIVDNNMEMAIWIGMQVVRDKLRKGGDKEKYTSIATMLLENANEEAMRMIVLQTQNEHNEEIKTMVFKIKLDVELKDNGKKIKVTNKI